MKGLKYCSKCGERVDIDATFCSHCGATIEATEVASLKEDSHRKTVHSLLKKVRWSWMFTSVAIVLMLVFADLTVLNRVYSGSPNTSEGIPLATAIWSVMLMIFLGSFITALLSPGKTTLEPALGCAFIVIFSSLLQRNVEGLFFGWLLPYFLGLGGAKVGEFLSGKLRHRKQLAAQ